MKTKYKAILFDMDGTLLNTIEDIADSLNFVLEKYGCPQRSINEVMHMVGSGAFKGWPGERCPSRSRQTGRWCFGP